MQHNLLGLDIAGAVLDFIANYFFIRASRWAWPTGLIAAVVNIILYALAGIYADTALNFYYFCAMFYGWWHWSHKGPDNRPLRITHITWPLALLLMVIVVASTWGVMLVLKQYTNSQIPFWDAVSTVLSAVGLWLICQKIIEAWLLWFVVDIVYIGLYFYKHIPAHSVLLVIYLGMAVAGYWRWYRLMKQEEQSWSGLLPSMTSET